MRRPLLVLVLFLVAGSSQAEEPKPIRFPSESESATTTLRAARKLADEKRWGEALDKLRPVSQEAKLAEVEPNHLRSVNQAARAILATFPDEELARYRRALDARSRNRFEQAAKNLDPVGLRAIVEEGFCSDSAAKALDLLGQLAFEEGRFDEAMFWWARLASPLLGAKRGGVLHPTPSKPLVEIHAKQVLCSIFRPADKKRCEKLVAEFRRIHPDAKGRLAGKQGTYHEILATALESRLAHARHGDWPTYAGSPSRTRIDPLEDGIDSLGLLLRRPAFHWDIAQERRLEAPVAPPWDLPESSAREFAFHPVVLGHRVYLGDSTHVFEFDAKSGANRTLFETGALWRGIEPALPVGTPDVAYTASAGRSCLFVRQGRMGVGEVTGLGAKPGDPDFGKVKQERSLVACLDVGSESPLRWWVDGLDLDGAVLEGAPLVDEGRVYMLATRVRSERTSTYLLCFPLEGRSGRTRIPLWKVELCETREIRAGESRGQHRLLTLAGPSVVYHSHSGAVVCVDRLTGKPVWARRFPGEPKEEFEPLPGREAEPEPVAPLPPLFWRSIVFVARLGARELLALDASTGSTLWSRKNVRVVHFLGVEDGKLIFTTPTGLRGLPAESGLDTGGWKLPESGTLAPMGRGILLGGCALWPTAKGVLPVRQSDGRLAVNPTLLRRVPPGNLAYRDGVLVSAGVRTVTAFIRPRWKLSRLEEEVEKHPDSVELRLALADALVEEENNDEAETHLRRIGAHTAAQFWAKRGDSKRERAVWQRVLDSRKESSRLVRVDGGWQRAGILASDSLGKSDSPKSERAAQPKPAIEPNPPLIREKTIQLERGEVILDEDSFAESPGFVTARRNEDGSSRVRFRSVEGDSVLWEKKLSLVPTWSARFGSSLVLAGSAGLVGVRESDGSILWQLNSPEGYDCNDFSVNSGLVFVFLGRAHLLAVESRTGRVSWSKSLATGELGFPEPHDGFHSIHHFGDVVWLRYSGGSEILDARTGESKGVREDSERRWGSAPVQLSDELVVLTRDPTTVECAERTTGKTRWFHELPDSTLLSGEAPVFRVSGEVVLVAIPTNIGCLLQRLDPKSGYPMWDASPLLGIETASDLAEAIIRDNRVCLVEGRTLVSRSLETGKPTMRKAIEGLGPSSRLWRFGGVAVVSTSLDAKHFRYSWLGHVIQYDVFFPTVNGEPGAFWLVDLDSFRLFQRIELDGFPFIDKRKLRADRPAWFPNVVVGKRSENGATLRVRNQSLVLGFGSTVWLARWTKND